MSNTVRSYILVHDGGKLTVEDVNLAVYGLHPLPVYDGGGENYYSAHQSQDSEWITVRSSTNEWGSKTTRHSSTTTVLGPCRKRCSNGQEVQEGSGRENEQSFRHREGRVVVPCEARICSRIGFRRM